MFMEVFVCIVDSQYNTMCNVLALIFMVIVL